MGHNIGFKGEIWKLIPKLFFLPLLIWSSDTVIISLPVLMYRKSYCTTPPTPRVGMDKMLKFFTLKFLCDVQGAVRRHILNVRPGRVAQSVGHLTRKSRVLGLIPGLATYFRFSFRFFKKGSCQLLAKVCARSTG